MSQPIRSKVFVNHSSWLFNEIIQGFYSLPTAHTGTLVLCPLTSRMLLLSDQLMYQRVPAVVPTIPISIVLSNAALTDVPSSIISCSNTTLVPLKGRHGETTNNEAIHNRHCLERTTLSFCMSPTRQKHFVLQFSYT